MIVNTSRYLFFALSIFRRFNFSRLAPKNILGPFRPHFYEVKSPPFFQASKVEIMAGLIDKNEGKPIKKYIFRDFAFILLVKTLQM